MRRDTIHTCNGLHLSISPLSTNMLLFFIYAKDYMAFGKTSSTTAYASSGVKNKSLAQGIALNPAHTLRLPNALNSEDRGLKVRFSLATIAFDRESAQMSQILSSQGKNAPSNPYPHYLVRLATSRYMTTVFMGTTPPTPENTFLGVGGGTYKRGRGGKKYCRGRLRNIHPTPPP